MFFRKKQEQVTEKLRSELQEMCREVSRKTDHAADVLARLEKTVGRHEMAIDDLLDILEENRGETEKALAGIQEELRFARESQVSPLLELIWLMHEQQNDVRRQLVGSEIWKRQFILAEQKQEKLMAQAGYRVTGEMTEPVDYELHEIVGVQETEDPALNHCIAQVLEHGYIYRDHVRKARVIAYQYKETE